jgi:hypothetical protein
MKEEHEKKSILKKITSTRLTCDPGYEIKLTLHKKKEKITKLKAQ